MESKKQFERKTRDGTETGKPGQQIRKDAIDGCDSEINEIDLWTSVESKTYGQRESEYDIREKAKRKSEKGGKENCPKRDI